MLVRLMYASRAQVAITAETLSAILKTSRERNPAHGVTGVLCFSGETFMQVLEGGRSQVNALYNRIARDERHHDVVLLNYEEIGERRFTGWSMGQVNLGRLNASLLLKYSDTAVLDPHAMSGAAALSLFYELVATASVTCQN